MSRSFAGGPGNCLYRAGRFVRKLHSPDHDSLNPAFRGHRGNSGADHLSLEFSVIALIGLILLIGIVKKNGIMIVHFALEAERKEGKEPEEAIYQACLLWFDLS